MSMGIPEPGQPKVLTVNVDDPMEILVSMLSQILDNQVTILERVTAVEQKLEALRKDAP
jgi:hypothetical protein